MTACPALKKLCISKGHISAAFMQTLSKTCPRMTSLELSADQQSAPYLQEILQLQPALLPHLNTLTLRVVGYSLPDMTRNHSITTLALPGFKFNQQANWMRLPSKLEHLYCKCVGAGPPAMPITQAMSHDPPAPLSSLVSLTVEKKSASRLPAIAALLRATPNLQDLDSGQYHTCAVIMCKGMSMDHTDMVVLSQHMHLKLIREALYCFDCAALVAPPPQPCVGDYPCLLGVTHCMILTSPPESLPLLLAYLPDLQVLMLNNDDIDDDGLLAVASCVKVTALRLTHCNKVSEAGLDELCRRLPVLRNVLCKSCSQFTQPSRLLRLRGRNVWMAAS